MDNINHKEQYAIDPRPTSPEVTDEKPVVRDGDAALDFLRGEAVAGEAEAIDERRLLRKIDWMVVPLTFACYLLQYLDKSLLNYAAVMGIREDLVGYSGHCSFEFGGIFADLSLGSGHESIRQLVPAVLRRFPHL